MVQSREETSVYLGKEVVDGHGRPLYQVFASRVALAVRVRGHFDLCERTAKSRRNKDTCCVIKRMRNGPHGKRSLLPQGRGRGECGAGPWLIRVTDRAAHWDMSRCRLRYEDTSDVKKTHASVSCVSVKTSLLRVVKSTPHCRDSVMCGELASLSRSGTYRSRQHVDTSTHERGGE